MCLTHPPSAITRHLDQGRGSWNLGILVTDVLATLSWSKRKLHFCFKNIFIIQMVYTDGKLEVLNRNIYIYIHLETMLPS